MAETKTNTAQSTLVAVPAQRKTSQKKSGIVSVRIEMNRYDEMLAVLWPTLSSNCPNGTFEFYMNTLHSVCVRYETLLREALANDRFTWHGNGRSFAETAVTEFAEIAQNINMGLRDAKGHGHPVAAAIWNEVIDEFHSEIDEYSGGEAMNAYHHGWKSMYGVTWLDGFRNNWKNWEVGIPPKR